MNYKLCGSCGTEIYLPSSLVTGTCSDCRHGVSSGVTAAFPKMNEVLAQVRVERFRQESLRIAGKFKQTCADPKMSDNVKFVVLGEEFGEVARELAETAIDPKRENLDNLKKELIQVAAVCVAWCEAIEAKQNAHT